MRQRLKSAHTHIDIRTAGGLVIGPGHELLLPSPLSLVVLTGRRCALIPVLRPEGRQGNFGKSSRKRDSVFHSSSGLRVWRLSKPLP
jgi:hypothetical protein